MTNKIEWLYAGPEIERLTFVHRTKDLTFLYYGTTTYSKSVDTLPWMENKKQTYFRFNLNFYNTKVSTVNSYKMIEERWNALPDNFHLPYLDILTSVIDLDNIYPMEDLCEAHHRLYNINIYKKDADFHRIQMLKYLEKVAEQKEYYKNALSKLPPKYLKPEIVVPELLKPSSIIP